jgi:hypothetical protein
MYDKVYLSTNKEIFVNIFKILSSNDGKVYEPSVTAFLAYLLNPQEDHGMGSLFLQELINSCDKNFFKELCAKNGEIVDFSGNTSFFAEILPEYTVPNPDGGESSNRGKNKRDIDILIELSKNKNNSEHLYSICLENKIQTSSASTHDTQLDDEYRFLEKYYEQQSNEHQPKIYFIYLTPLSANLKEADRVDCIFKNLEVPDSDKFHLYWISHNDKPCIFNMLQNILEKNIKGQIDPINEQATFLIRSFMAFIKSGFKSYIEESKETAERKSYGKPVIQYLRDFCETELKKEIAYKIDDIKAQFSQYVKKQSGGIDLNQGTRNAHIIKVTVNNTTRQYYNVNQPDKKEINLLCFIDENDHKQGIKLFNPEKDTNINIYYNNNGKLKKIKAANIY